MIKIKNPPSPLHISVSRSGLHLTQRQRANMLTAEFMPLPSDTLARLCEIVGPENVLTSKEDLIAYSFDGTAAMQQMPGCVAFATTTEQVANVLKLANQNKTPVVTRGSGTGLS